MSFLISIIPTILVLGILIMIHELGHFLACRLTKVEVDKFSIGFGPEILKWQGKRTSYVLSLFPLGGYVKPAGESVSELEGEGKPQPGDYLAAPLAARIFIVCAGVLMNYILAFILFIAIFMMGRPVMGTTLGDFIKGYPAYESGLEKGDRVVSVNGKPVNTWTDLTDELQIVPDGAVELFVERSVDGKAQMLPFSLVPIVEEVPNAFGELVKMHRLGVVPSPEANYFERYSFMESLKHSFETTLHLTMMTHKAIFSMLLGKLSMQSISGPVGIISMTGSAAQLGLPYLLQLMATLSVSLAVINLLPIPALDGGHLLFLLIEAVRRKKVSLLFQERVTQIGFTLLLVLMVFLVYNDLVNINVFGKIKGMFGS